MAHAWIKVEHPTPDKPEIGMIAERLGIDHDAAFGKFIRWMIWADQNTDNGHALRVTNVTIDRVTFQTGFADALVEVGWLTGESGNYHITKFDNHNGESAKKRAKDQERQKRSRANRDSCHALGVTKSGPEKSREEKKNKDSADAQGSSSSRKFIKPTLEDLREYAASIGFRTFDPQAFLDHYDSNGWKVGGRGAMKDWRAAVRTWRKRNPDGARPMAGTPTTPNGETYGELNFRLSRHPAFGSGYENATDEQRAEFDAMAATLSTLPR